MIVEVGEPLGGRYITRKVWFEKCGPTKKRWYLVFETKRFGISIRHQIPVRNIMDVKGGYK